MTASDLLTTARHDFGSLAQAHTRFTELQTQSRITSTDLEYAAEGFLVRSMSLFEALIRDLFVQALAGTTSLSGVKSFVVPRDVAHAEEIIYGETDRLGWLPLDMTLARADRLLHFGQPFVRLRLRQLEIVDLARIVRNRIAHDGEEALRVYEKRVMHGDKSFAKPGRWLLHSRGESGPDNLSTIVALFTACATALCSDGPDLNAELGPPSLMDANARLPSGSYECTSCEETLKHSAHGESPRKCSSCGLEGVRLKLLVLDGP